MEIYDRDGNRIGLLRLAELKKDHDYRFLARTQVGRWQVVTTWLGIDQRPDEVDPDLPDPLIYGTVAMVETPDGPDGYEVELFDEREFHAATAAEAMEDHVELRTRLRLDPDTLPSLDVEDLRQLVDDLRAQRQEARTYAWVARHYDVDRAVDDGWLPAHHRQGAGGFRPEWLVDLTPPSYQHWFTQKGR